MLVKQNRYIHLRFCILLVLFVILLFMRYAFQINISKGTLTVFIAVIALTGNRNEILAVTMSCIPLHNAVDLFVSVGICMIAYILKNSKFIKVNSAAFITLLIITWEYIHCFNYGFSIKLFIVSIIPLVFLALIMCTDMEDIDYGFIVRTMAVVTAVVCIVMLSSLFIMADFNIAEAFTGIRRLGVFSNDSKMQNLAVNPNSLGIVCLLSITSLLQLRILEKSQKSDSLLILILLVFGIMTASRTFLICLIMMIVLLSIGMQVNTKKSIQFLISLSVLVIIAAFILNRYFPNTIEYYIYRFQKDDITNGRDLLIQIYNNYISNNMDVMFFGIGLTNYEDKIINICHISNGVPHNAVHEIIIAWGIIGIILFSIQCIVMIIQSRKVCRQQTILNYIPLFIILLKSMAGQLLTSGYTMMALVLAYLSLCQNFKQTEQN